MFGSEPMFVHIITLCLGLIIAYGLMQIVELFRRRRSERKAREAAAKQVARDSVPPQV
jgi:uncharacterized protein (DUF2062 family)